MQETQSPVRWADVGYGEFAMQPLEACPLRSANPVFKCDFLVDGECPAWHLCLKSLRTPKGGLGLVPRAGLCREIHAGGRSSCGRHISGLSHCSQHCGACLPRVAAQPQLDAQSRCQTGECCVWVAFYRKTCKDRVGVFNVHV